MTISLSSDRLLKLVSTVTEFVSGSSAHGEGCRHKLWDWLHLIRWMSWALTVCPLLRPVLSSVYQKVAGKNIPNAAIFVNGEVKHDFSWFTDAFHSFSGVQILRSLTWRPGEADLQLYCDASLTGLSFWAPSSLHSFTHTLPPTSSGSIDVTIFWFEALCVASAIEYTAFLHPVPWCLAIYTDRLDTVQIFNSLKASGTYNPILLFSCGLLLQQDIDLHVFHIPGDLNVVTDALSCTLLHVAAQHAPCLQVFSFQPPSLSPGNSFSPPRCMLGSVA